MPEKRYSQLYIDPPAHLKRDDERARRRLHSRVIEIGPNTAARIRSHLESEIGVSVPTLERFFVQGSLTDLLDSVTIIYNYLRKHFTNPVGEEWRNFASRVFAEQHLAYVVDSEGVVHPTVDQEFQRNRISTLAGLQLPRYSNSLIAFERVSEQLAKQPQDAKEGWRDTFHAVEGLFRLMFPSCSQLRAAEVDIHLAPAITKQFAGDGSALRAANKLLASFKDWIDASHNYRHEAGKEEPHQPPLDLAILAISHGTSFLRWLIDIDQEMQDTKGAS